MKKQQNNEDAPDMLNEYDFSGGVRGKYVGRCAAEMLNVGRMSEAWAVLAGHVCVPHTEQEYERVVAMLDSLIDEVGEDESHPLASLMEVLGVLIEKYEAEHVPELTT